MTIVLIVAPEIRTVLRYIDDYINSGDYNSAIERAIQALKSFDEEREFDNSQIVLERLIEVAQNAGKNVSAAQYLDLLRVRVILARDMDKYQDLNIRYSDLPKTPLSELMKKNIGSERNVIVEAIERQDIFGDYSAIDEIPYLTFNKSEEAIDIIQDFYEEGRYLLNLLDRSTSLHQAINIDIGQPEEVNIVDRNHTYRVQ